ncbi:hypothetical protein C21_02137 [Arenibacter sp. NBRC 103722]|nr:hypothetical protein C21_02137 [Arenibacter sp. NBRC 103722]
MEKAYKNLGYFFLLLIPLTFLGFYKTYFIQFPSFEENITSFIHLHAIIASIWILLLIVQPLLILNRNNKVHRKIGKLSYIVFPILILSFVPQMIRIINFDAPQFLFFPLADSVLLILFYSLAIYHRRKVSKHMRYIIGSATVFLGPTIGRIGPHIFEWSEIVTQNIQYGIIYLILIGLIFYDKRNKNNYRPYLLILTTWIIHLIIFNMIF